MTCVYCNLGWCGIVYSEFNKKGFCMPDKKEKECAILLPNRRMNSLLLAMQRHAMCQVCGYPYFQGGDLCTECETFVKQVEEKEATRLAQQFEDFLSPHSRFIHVFGVGYVDPWTRDGQTYLDP
jgi:hypothetical protein